MTRGLEKAFAAPRHDNKATVMSAAEIEAHRVFLTGLGTASREIDLTINVIQSTLRGDEVAIPDRGRLRKRKIKHAKEIRSFSTSFVVPGTTDTKRETEKRWLFGLSEGCSAGCPAIQPIADQSDPRS